MSDIALEFNQVWKKFKRGEKYNSLRDLVPAITKKFFLGNHRGELEEKEFWALKDVSFQVKRGEALGVIGPNGAGKSTILKLLSGIMRPNKGEIQVNGRLSALIEVGAGFHPDLTGRENIYLNGAILGMKKDEIDKKFDEIVDFSGISDFIDTPVKRYSSGMYARLGFSVAAHVDTEILLVDEVLAVGDTAFQKKCLGKMQEVTSVGRTVLFISHNMAAIENMCSKTMLLEAGHIAYIGETKSAIKTYLQTFSDNISSISLDKQSSRTGNGRIRFTYFHVEDGAGVRVKIVQNGQDVVLVSGFACADSDRLRNVNVGFGIHSSTGERLAVLYSSYTGQEFESVPTVGEFRCRIPRFPFVQGRYFVYGRVEVNGIEADSPCNGVGFFDVHEGDFFGTGRMIGDRGQALFLIKGDWSLKPKD
jgi:lipopolysaccharide transport system ATP-binding protein